jgi:hypothetical protein
MNRQINTLAYKAILNELHCVFGNIPDFRTPNKVAYSLKDILLSGLAMMFWQDCSLLSFQEKLKKRHGKSNLQSLFNVSTVPSDSQFRDVIDRINSDQVHLGLNRIFKVFKTTRLWQEYKYLSGRAIVLIDGTEFFRSKKISCPKCMKRNLADGSRENYHQALVASLVNPNIKQPLPIATEEIRCSDGKTKNDCEINAAKRLIPKLAQSNKHLDMVIVADGLYSKTPMIELIKKYNMNYIFVAKAKDHKYLNETIKAAAKNKKIKGFSCQDKAGNIHQYRFLKNVFVFSTTDLQSNWISYTVTSKSGKKKYHNEWLTSINPTKKTVPEIASAGRARAKIENETFNALKNHGFHFEHNFGHGKINLHFNFLILNLIAFLMHQILALSDKKYKSALQYRSSVKEFAQHIKFSCRIITWPDWKTLIKNYLDEGPEIILKPG